MLKPVSQMLIENSLALGHNAATLEYCNDLQKGESPNPVTRIFFDESHDELLRSQPIDDTETDQRDNLTQALQGMGFDVFPASERAATNPSLSKTKGKTRRGANPSSEAEDDALAETPAIDSSNSPVNDTFIEELERSQVAVLGAPREPLQQNEVEAIVEFVRQGGSLLIAHSYESLWCQDNKASGSEIHRLLKSFGISIKQLLNWTEDEVDASHIRPHYLSSSVNHFVVKEPTYLEILDEKPYVVATLPVPTEQSFLAAIEFENGRVVVIGDFIIFGDAYLGKGNNRELALNIFRWLTRKNPLNCRDAQFDKEVRYGKTATFSIVLENSHGRRLEFINCFLESNAGALIHEPLQQIRFLPVSGKTRLQWTVEPQHLGSQNLRLAIEFERSPDDSLFLDSVAKFTCVADAEVELVFLNRQELSPEIVETGVDFDVQASVKWATGAKQISLQLELKHPLAHFTVEPIEQNSESSRWRLRALDEGNWTLELEVKPLNQRVTRLVQAVPSIHKQIADLEQDAVPLLDAEIRHKLSQIRRELVADEIQNIPFRLLTPENYIKLLEPPETQVHLLEVLQAAWVETRTNRPLVQELLLNVMPTYSAIYGCCVPYDPKLAEHVAENHATYEENLAYAFMSIEGNDRYGRIWLEQNIAALLLHEKYGHGFFATQTTLGKQLAILERHGFLQNSQKSQSSANPYSHKLYQEEKESLEILHHSSIILNEGFATWVELTLLPRLSEVLGQAAYRRRDFLFNQNASLDYLSETSPYFEKFPPTCSSKYEEGCELLESIQDYFGKDCGPKCAVQAIIKAADVNIGVSEINGQVQFGISPQSLASALLDDTHSNQVRVDERLRAIESTLEEHSEEIREEQKQLQCHRTCLHSECPVNKIVEKTLGW